MAGRIPTTFLREGSGWYFVASIGSAFSVCRADGSAAGTVQLITMSSVDVIDQLTGCAGAVYFVAEDEGDVGSELWKTDGTASGTALVKDVRPGIGAYDVQYMRVGVGLVFFGANDGTSGVEPWRSDGTTAGTFAIDINPGSGSSYPDPGIEIGGRYVFAARADGSGSELWSTDGTASGSVPAVDLEPGTSCHPEFLTPISSTRFLATMFTAATGSELLLSDGTTAGTQLVVDLGVAASSSFPNEFHVSFGQTMFFSADDGPNGRELWSLDASGSHARSDRAMSLCLRTSR